MRYICSYVHQGRIGVLVEMASESDFAHRTDEFQEFARALAMQIAASKPASVAELMHQAWLMDGAITVKVRLAQLSDLLVEKLSVLRFVLWDTDQQLSP